MGSYSDGPPDAQETQTSLTPVSHTPSENAFSIVPVVTEAGTGPDPRQQQVNGDIARQLIADNHLVGIAKELVPQLLHLRLEFRLA